MTRFYGVFANCHHLHVRILPVAPVPASEQQLALHFADAGRDGFMEPARPRRLGWAKGQAACSCLRCGCHDLSHLRRPDRYHRGCHRSRGNSPRSAHTWAVPSFWSIVVVPVLPDASRKDRAGCSFSTWTRCADLGDGGFACVFLVWGEPSLAGLCSFAPSRTPTVLDTLPRNFQASRNVDFFSKFLHEISLSDLATHYLLERRAKRDH